MGASLDLWSCLAGATAKRSVGSCVTSLEGWPVTSSSQAGLSPQREAGHVEEKSESVGKEAPLPCTPPSPEPQD